MTGLILPGKSTKAKGTRRETQSRFSVLSVSPMPEDHLMLRHILDSALWKVSAVATRRSAIERLRASAVSVVICESVLEDGTWKDILEHNQACSYAPPLIVTSRLTNEYLWAEVLNLGGYDVLPKPFNDREVRHVLQTVSLQQTPAAQRTRAAGAA
jgi:DNA-binding response OmpR family regulator